MNVHKGEYTAIRIFERLHYQSPKPPASLAQASGGGGGIRTLVTGKGKHAFQACALDHSATPPDVKSQHGGKHAGVQPEFCGSAPATRGKGDRAGVLRGSAGFRARTFSLRNSGPERMPGKICFCKSLKMRDIRETLTRETDLKRLVPALQISFAGVRAICHRTSRNKPKKTTS